MKRCLLLFVFVIIFSSLVGCSRCKTYYTPVDEAKSMGTNIDKNSVVTYKHSDGETFDAIIYEKCK